MARSLSIRRATRLLRRPPTATSASARSHAVPSSRRPPSARSTSGSAQASPPGWTSTRASAMCRTTWTLPSALQRDKTLSKYAPAAPSATSRSIVFLPTKRPTKDEPMTATASPSALSVSGLRKSFGEKTVLDGIDLDIAEGTTFSLLGPNGAGKTTAVQILSTLLDADAGEVRVAGFDVAREPDAVRAVIGVTGQFSAVDGLLTGEENLMLMADLHHLDRRVGRQRSCELLDLAEAAGQMVATYSGGMRRRLDLAMTLMG